MKRTLISYDVPAMCLSALIVAMGGCSSATVAPPPPLPVGSLEMQAVHNDHANLLTEKERALPGLYIGALASSDGGAPFALLSALVDPDLTEFSFPGMFTTHEATGVVAAHARLFGAFDDRQFVLTRTWRTPDQQIFEWVMSGTHAGEWFGVAATRKPIAFKGVTWLWTKDDGSIRDIHIYFDVGLVKAQLGGPGASALADMKPPTPLLASAAQVFDQVGSDAEKAAVALVTSWLDSLETNKQSEYLGHLSDDFELYPLESAAPLHGKEQQKRYFEAAHRAIGQLDVSVSAVQGAGPYVVVEYDIDGEQLAPLTWIPSVASIPIKSLQVVHFDLVDVCEVHDGKIRRVWRYDNPSQTQRASTPRPQASTSMRSQ